jgi:hypothetical protein
VLILASIVYASVAERLRCLILSCPDLTEYLLWSLLWETILSRHGKRSLLSIIKIVEVLLDQKKKTHTGTCTAANCPFPDMQQKPTCIIRITHFVLSKSNQRSASELCQNLWTTFCTSTIHKCDARARLSISLRVPSERGI